MQPAPGDPPAELGPCPTRFFVVPYPPPGPPGAYPEWLYALRHSTRLLAFGSILLLGGAVGFYFSGVPFIGLFASLGFLLLTVLGAVFHLFAWVGLREVVEESNGLLAAFVSSIVGFVIGAILVFPTTFGQVQSAGDYGALLVCGGAWLVVPFHPLAYAPVVFAHAAIFVTALESHRTKEGMLMIIAGSVVLVGIAGLSLAAFLIFGFSGLLALAVGGTAVGYGLVAAGWRREYDASGTPLSNDLLRATPET